MAVLSLPMPMSVRQRENFSRGLRHATSWYFRLNRNVIGGVDPLLVSEQDWLPASLLLVCARLLVSVLRMVISFLRVLVPRLVISLSVMFGSGPM
jgi:hypothetical protein